MKLLHLLSECNSRSPFSGLRECIQQNATIRCQFVSMSFARRLVSLCLTLAFASYGLIAAAPAHAHDHSDASVYAIHAVALDAGHDDTHGQDHHEALDHHDKDLGNDTTPAEHGGMHIHAVASFTTVSGSSAIPELISTAVLNRSEQSIVRVSGQFEPLKKPPRTFL